MANSFISRTLKRALGFAVAAAGLVAALPGTSRADGFIIVREPPIALRPTPGHFQFAPLEVTYHRVNVTVTDQVATTVVDQEFHNPNPARLEGTYLFPLPPGAHIDKFEMDINGKLMQAELLDAQKARTIYEDIVRRYKDPALLEYMGRDAFKARIFPIEPNSRKKIKITYTQLLKSDTGLVEYTYPLNTEKFSAKPLEDVSVTVTLATKDPIKALYSPSHNVTITRDGDRKATVAYAEKNVRPDTDFKLMFSRSTAAVGVDLLTYRNSPDDGYFLLLASPGLEAAAGQVQKKDVCFVLDTSGSMALHDGKKMEQAKKALSFCLQNLNEGDRFEIVRFSTEAEPFFKQLVPADKANIEKALAFVQTLKPIGGTAIEDALTQALKLRDGGPPNSGTERVFNIIFLTDGQPTIGETGEDPLVAKVKAANVANTRIFSFGVGTDINTHLLDRIAADSKAFSQYVLPSEDLEVKLSSFYTKIKEPALANVQVAFTGGAAGDVRATQVYPNVMPDLYKGEMLIAFGRYTGKGPAAVKVTGTINGERREFVTDVNFADHDTGRQYIPQLWATRRVGWLLDEIRLRGESTELKDEVVKLAREHGIVTPYTAYLILEDEAARGVPLAMQNFRELGADRPALAAAAEKYDSTRAEFRDARFRAGGRAVDNAKDIDDLKRSDNVAQARKQGERLAKASAPGRSRLSGFGRGVAEADGASGGVGGPAGDTTAAATEPAAPAEHGYREAQTYAEQARVVNGRCFYQNGKTWTDSTAQAKKGLKEKQIKFNSDEYFTLLAEHPDCAQWLALGEEVDVVLGDTLYQVRSGS